MDARQRVSIKYKMAALFGAIALFCSALVALISCLFPLLFSSEPIEMPVIGLALAGAALTAIALTTAAYFYGGFIGARISERIRSAQECAGKLVNGDYGLMRDLGVKDETQELSDTMNELAERLGHGVKLFSKLIRCSADPMCIIENGRIIEANGALAKLFRANGRDALLGKGIAAFSPESQPSGEFSANKAETLLKEASSGLARRLEWTLKSGNDATLAELSLTPAVVAGRNIVCCLWRDISAERRAAAELEEYRERLERLVTERTEGLRVAQEEAILAAKAKNLFLANMTHETRTPLNGILGMAELLAHTPLTHEQRDYLDAIRVSGHTLLHILTEIVEFAGMESGRLKLEERSFSPVNCVDDCFDLYSSRVASKGLDLFYEADPDMPYRICADEARLRQILANLLDNATKYTFSGEIVVSSKLLAPGVCRFSVSDTGAGFGEDVRKKLLTALAAEGAGGLSMQLAKSQGELGLGLNICGKLVKLLGGEIDVSSEPGKGSVFSFTFKFKEAGDDSAILVPRPDLESFEAAGVLVVVSSARLCSSLCALLRSMRLNPAACSTSREAIAMLKRDPGRFNYAIIDEKLRDGEGLALAATIKAMDCGKDLRLALFCHAKLRERMGSDERIDGFISKPLMSGRFSEQFLAAFKQGEGVSTFGSDEVDPHLGSKIPLAILVAEDNPVNLKLILGILGRMGYGADHALNGKLAVDAARSRKYDLVLMDCQMPEMDGIEATKIILNELPEASRPDAVIALTAHAIEEYKSKCLDAGMKDFLVKPVNSVRIQETIRRFFGQRQAGGDKTPPAKGKPDGAPHASEDAEIPLVDYTPLREHAQIRDSFLKELVEIFEEDAPKSIASVRDNVARGNLKAAGDAAHGLKGSAASLGLRRLAEVSLRLQKAGRDGAAAEIPGLLLELDSAFKESLSALKTAVSEICSGGAS